MAANLLRLHQNARGVLSMTVRRLSIFLGCLFCLQAGATVSRKPASGGTALLELLQRDCPELLLASQDDFKVQIPPLGTPAKREAIQLLRHLLPQLFQPATTKAGAQAASEILRLLVNQAANEPFSKKYSVINNGELV